MRQIHQILFFGLFQLKIVCFGLFQLKIVVVFFLDCQPAASDFGSGDLRQHECDDGARASPQTSQREQHLDGVCKWVKVRIGDIGSQKISRHMTKN